jgi:putative oxidoreductase
MNTNFQNAVALTGRALLALLFILSGYQKLTGFSGTADFMASVGMPMAQVLLVGAIAVELGGGLMLLAGWKARWAAAAIALFTIPATLIFHAFWAGDPAQAQNQFIHFMKNVSIIGGMLMVVAMGPGGWSIDGRRGNA